MSASLTNSSPLSLQHLKQLSPQSRKILRSEIQRRLTEHKAGNWLARYQPYPKQVAFHDAGKDHGERLFMAGNQQGKTVAGGAEVAIHCTGRYPDWWDGAVFDKAPKWWVSGITGESARDNPQRILIGPPQIKSAWGTGTLPRDCIKDYSPARGIPDALDSIVVRWGGGGDVQASDSIILIKSYEKGREKWQGDTVDGVWFDEEPPMDIYSEGRTRTNNGQLGVFNIITFTPLLGMSEVVRLFLTENELKEMK